MTLVQFVFLLLFFRREICPRVVTTLLDATSSIRYSSTQSLLVNFFNFASDHASIHSFAIAPSSLVTTSNCIGLYLCHCLPLNSGLNQAHAFSCRFFAVLYQWYWYEVQEIILLHAQNCGQILYNIYTLHRSEDN